MCVAIKFYPFTGEPAGTIEGVAITIEFPVVFGRRDMEHSAWPDTRKALIRGAGQTAKALLVEYLDDVEKMALTKGWKVQC